MDFTRHAVHHQSRSNTYDQGLREYMIGVFNNMFLALVITGITSFFTITTSMSKKIPPLGGIL